LLDLRYLKEEIEHDERHGSQVRQHGFAHVAKHGETGHEIGSSNGHDWFDLHTGVPHASA